MTTPGRQDIEAAARRVAAHVRETPVLAVSPDDLGLACSQVALKLELLQHTGSFKPRGAFNRVLSADVPDAGLIAASGGNHGLAVAHVGATLGFPTEIFVPETVPVVKRRRLEALGAALHLEGDVYDVARAASERRAAETGALIVHAYDQFPVVAGAGTAGRELEMQAPDADTILVAVGGGGLAAGIAAWEAPGARVVTVEPRRCPTFFEARRAGRPVPVEVGGLAKDSLAARQIGDIAYEVLAPRVRDAVLVEDDAIRDAQRHLWDRFRVVVEPGGATALAALLAGAYVPGPEETVAVLVCGANTDPPQRDGRTLRFRAPGPARRHRWAWACHPSAIGP